MAEELGIRDQPASQGDPGVKRRGLLRLGTLITALTGASAISAMGADRGQAAPGDTTVSNAYIPVAEKATPSGVATLDANAKILPAQLPDLTATILDIAGTISASAQAVKVQRVDSLGGAEMRASDARAQRALAAGEPAPGLVTTVVANGGAGRIAFPTNIALRKAAPLIIAFQGIGNSTPEPEASLAPMFNAALTAGYIVATHGMHGSSYGNEDSLRDAVELYREALKVAPINGIVIFGNSMGGLPALNALTQARLPNVLGVYLTQPVVDLRHRYENGREHEIKAAYHIAADGSEYAAKAKGYDPMRRPVTEFRGVPFHITASPGDSLVAQSAHALPLRDKLAGFNEVTYVAASGEHANATHFVPATFVAKLAEWCAGAAPDAPPQTITNYVVNPNFETSVSTWDSVSATFGRDTTDKHSETASMKVATNGTVPASGPLTAPVAVDPSNPYTASMWVKVPAGATIKIGLVEYTGANELVGDTVSPYTGTGAWERISVVRTFGATGTKFSVYVRTTVAQTISWFVDDVMLTKGNTLYTYANGNTSGWVWSGTANASTSAGPALP